MGPGKALRGGNKSSKPQALTKSTSEVSPATWTHGWSKHGSSRIPSNSNMVIIHIIICYLRVFWWYSAKTMFTPTMFSLGRLPGPRRSHSGSLSPSWPSATEPLSYLGALSISRSFSIHIYIYTYTHVYCRYIYTFWARAGPRWCPPVCRGSGALSCPRKAFSLVL